MDLNQASDQELIDECKRRGINILSDALIRLWCNQEDDDSISSLKPFNPR
jgi:hypothetical protein